MLLMLVAAFPAFAVIFYFALWMRDDALDDYQSRIRVQAEQLATIHAAQIEQTRLLLTTLTHIPELRAGRSKACASMLAEIMAKSTPVLDNLLVVQPDGNILCSAVLPGNVTNVSDLAWFRLGMATPGFRVGEYHISRRTAAAVATPTLPITENGHVIGLMAASLNLSWLNAHASHDMLPPGADFAIFDAQGTYVLHLPDTPSRIGNNIGNTRLWHTVIGLNDKGVFRARGLDDLPHLFAYVPLGPAMHPYARLLVDVPAQGANTESMRPLWLALGGLLVAVLLGLAVGGLGGWVLVTRPMRPIFATVKRVSAGQLSARTGVTRSDNEIGQLAGEVDLMAAALEERDRAVRHERDKAQSYLDLVGVMVVTLDRQGNVTLANRKICEVMGCMPLCHGVCGNWFDQFVPPEYQETAKQAFQRHMDGVDEMPEYGESLILTKAGERRLIAWRNTQLKDEQGSIVATLSAGEDITAIRRMQDDLLESREQYQTLVENVPGAVFRCEIEYPWPMVHISRAIADLAGVAAERFIDGAVHYGELIHPDDLAEVKQAVRDSVARHQPYQAVHRIRHADGGFRWVLTQGRCIQFDESPRWLEGVMLDITEQMVADLALRASEAKYRTLLENLPLIVWHKNTESVYMACNKAFASARNLTPEQVEGKTDFDIYPPELAEPYRANDRRMLESGQPEQYESTWENHGKQHTLQVTKVLLRDGHGNITGTLGIAEDNTESKHMQAEQERLQSQLQQAQKMEALGQLTGGIAHDFNNILASVLGFAKLALRRHTPDPFSELAEYLREIITAGERARDLVAKMLAFGRAQPGRLTQSLAPLPLAKEAIKMLASTIPSSIRIETRFEEDIPDIAIDSVAFHQILVNLVINARDAVGNKGLITTSLRRCHVAELECCACHRRFSGNYVELAVADNGQGIAPEILPRIFEPFFATKEVGKGSGMGLAMVHGLVNRASGHFRVESQPDGGTAFRIFLPVVKVGEAEASTAPVPDISSDMPPGRVLVVDDDTAILHLLRASLADAGWQVIAFDSPNKALEDFGNDPGRFDAAITDETMPELTGIELASALHSLRPDLPVILCTGYSDGLTEDTALKRGISRFLIKPVATDVLLKALNEVRGLNGCLTTQK